jgi:hypothetical protein
MANRTWRTVRGAVLAVVVALIGNVAQAIIYPIRYDPPTGPGTVQVRNEACLSDDDIRCVLDLLTTDLEDSNGDEWSLLSPFLDVADPEGSIIVDFESHRLVAFDSRPVELTFVGGGDEFVETISFASLSVDADNCSTSTLRLFSDGTTSLDGCSVADRGVYAIGPALAPEPASLALVLGGAGAAWLARRRKPRAYS